MPVTTFAYPYGEYSQETADIVKDLGLHCACTCDDRVVRAGVDPFKLPRTEILDWDGDEFAARLLRGFAL
jgi:peptidoglycan/xylan/chitin deacetylase (PgdA/CDA1 family)